MRYVVGNLDWRGLCTVIKNRYHRGINCFSENSSSVIDFEGVQEITLEKEVKRLEKSFKST